MHQKPHNVTKNPTEWVIIGCFGRPHGVHGCLLVHSFTDPEENLLQYTDWHMNLQKQWKPVELLRLEKTQKGILVQVKGYEDRETASLLTNANIAVTRTQLPALKKGEYYWRDLIGMRVVNQENVVLGAVKEILATGANDVLVVVGEKRYLIPYLPGQYVTNIDLERRLITAHWDADF